MATSTSSADGNHRVSVARASGFDSIEAHVTDIPVDCDLEPGDSLDEAIMKAEHARFLAETRLNERVPFVDIYFTRPGGFVKLLEHVHIHRRLLSQERGEDGHRWKMRRRTGMRRATARSSRRSAIASCCGASPGRTAADLYVWMWGYIFDAYRRMGEKVEPEEAAAMMELRAPSGFQQAVQGLMNRIGEASRALVSGARSRTRLGRPDLRMGRRVAERVGATRRGESGWQAGESQG